MKKSIPQYTFYKNKYGSKLLVDVVELKYVKRFFTKSPIHRLSYYDITFITKGEGVFSIENQLEKAIPRDTFFSKPGELRNWDTHRISNGYALIFEDDFLSSFLKDPLFVQHLSFFNMERVSSKLHLSEELYERIICLLKDIKMEIEAFQQNDIHVLRALLYEVLMLLNRAYQKKVLIEHRKIETGSIHLSKFVRLVGVHLKEEHSVQFYAGKLCITSSYLNEIVSSMMNLSAKQYIQNKLMDEAKKLLIYTDSSVSEVAYELHYLTVSYFIRCFRQNTGMTPLLYRNTHKP